MSEKLAIEGGEPCCHTRYGYGRQDIEDDDIQAVVGVLRSDYLTCGPKTEEFQDALGQVVEAKHTISVSNGTAALHVACLAADIDPGDEVIVSPITFAASANCVRYCGGTPIFADIDPDTWQIDPASIKAKVTDKTKAVVAVDFGGVNVDHVAIRNICDEHGLVFIEDAAHAIGTSDGGRPVGSIADLTCFSFHPVKTITTGEGGAVATNDDRLGQRALLFARHGITHDRSLMRNKEEGAWYYEQLELGYNYRMTDFQAALGISQLKKLERFRAKRQQVVAWYNERFADIPEVRFQQDSTPEETCRHLYVLRFDVRCLNTTRRFIFDALRAEGVPVNVHYLPVYRLPNYADMGYDPDCCPEANRYYEEAVTLPLHCLLGERDLEEVAHAIEKVVAHCRERA